MDRLSVVREQVSPSFTFGDGLNGSSANAVLFSQFSPRYAACSILGTDTENGSVGEFSGAGSFSIGMPLLCATVGPIVGVGPEKKMVWAHAGRIVTGMEDVQAGWDVAEMKPPANAGGATSLPYLPITVSSFCSEPQPTCRRLFDLGPEPFCQWDATTRREISVAADNAATKAATFANVCWVNRKGGAADHACAINHAGSYRG